jgi:hypothetical protein
MGIKSALEALSKEIICWNANIFKALSSAGKLHMPSGTK